VSRWLRQAVGVWPDQRRKAWVKALASIAQRRRDLRQGHVRVLQQLTRNLEPDLVRNRPIAPILVS
jgi:hypothetical protein